jgi:flagellar hook assembly protein FlgD
MSTGTTINFSVARACRVQLRILDVAGRLVMAWDLDVGVGKRSVRWDGRDESGHSVASGVYLYQLNAEGFSSERKMLVLE